MCSSDLVTEVTRQAYDDLAPAIDRKTTWAPSDRVGAALGKLDRGDAPGATRDLEALVGERGDLDEAVRRVNDSSFGLQTGVFTNDLAGAWRAFHELEVGGVIVNDIPTYRVDHMPYGGVKDSGLGREGLRWAIEDMTETRIMVLAWPQ